MDISTLDYDDKSKTVTIEDLTPRETVEAVKELIDKNKIDKYGFQAAYFSYIPGAGPSIEFSRYYSTAPYQHMIIKTINLKNTEKDIGKFTDVECAIEILKLLQLYIFESIEEVLKDPDNYVKVRGGGYNITIDKSGFFRWDNPYNGATFIYD